MFSLSTLADIYLSSLSSGLASSLCSCISLLEAKSAAKSAIESALSSPPSASIDGITDSSITEIGSRDKDNTGWILVGSGHGVGDTVEMVLDTAAGFAGELEWLGKLPRKLPGNSLLVSDSRVYGSLVSSSLS
jgi:hypothetical protein